ncbi:sensor histidine kinase [Evansella tamaricis]|uniref:histidine kinase n=1 Tax=Evansella tamaricis TaxID=2069301 RepID=A0ABS6JER9_9BACI|nr:ATP-binding protein [Evansella tamaricis]MBU9712154.1 HAMP domain-containing protein [Evansella tamaricis]
MGIRVRLLTAFLSIIILPVVTIIGFFAFFSYQLDQLSEEQNLEIDNILSEINQEIIENYHSISETQIFFSQIEHILEQYNIEIIITSEERELLFDSKDIKPVDDDFMFTMRQSQVQTLSGDIYNIEIKSNTLDLSPNQSYNKIITTIFISVGSGILLLIILVIVWTIYISRTILQPLKQIYTATEEMTEGNLSYPIEYKKKDEIGRFINGFNTMRDHLRQSIAKQQQYEQNRKELIATISHDLRTPLQSIKGYVEGINDGIVQNEEMKKRYLQVILSKTEQLDRLIEDLFEFSKIELDQLVMDKILINSGKFFTTLLKDAESDCQQHDVELKVEGSIPSVVLHMDPKRIEQVFTNLIDNALQYGGKRIVVHFETDKEANRLTVHVKDNGPGISEEDVPNIFNRFYRGEKSRSREHGGTGLGLAIVKSIIESHDGTVWVESRLTEGSSFSFSLPVIKGTNHN